MNIQPQYLAYMGGSVKEVIEIGDTASWKQFRTEYFNPYPMLFPVGTNIEKAQERLKSLAWCTWNHTPDARIFVVYFEQIIARSFVNFIFMVYEDEDGSKTRELCNYKAEDWIELKKQIQQESSAPISIAASASPDSDVKNLLASWDSRSGLALRFPRRYKNDSYSGCFDEMSTIFPEKAPEEPKASPTPKIDQEEGDDEKKKSRMSLGGILFLLLLAYAVSSTLYAIRSSESCRTYATENQNLQKEIQLLKQQIQQQKQVPTSIENAPNKP